MNKSRLKRAIYFFLLSVGVTVIANILTYTAQPDVKSIIEEINTQLSADIKEAVSVKKIWAYIVNNGFVVPFQMFILALIPSPFLYLLNILSTVSLLGVLFGTALRIDGLPLIIASLPHSLFEILGYCIFAAVLFEFNKGIRIKVGNLFKKDKTEVALYKKFFETIKVYVVWTISFIIVAAVLETYLSELIFQLFG